MANDVLFDFISSSTSYGLFKVNSFNKINSPHTCSLQSKLLPSIRPEKNSIFLLNWKPYVKRKVKCEGEEFSLILHYRFRRTLEKNLSAFHLRCYTHFHIFYVGKRDFLFSSVVYFSSFFLNETAANFHARIYIFI